jgi:hypothetical protein
MDPGVILGQGEHRRPGKSQRRHADRLAGSDVSRRVVVAMDWDRGGSGCVRRNRRGDRHSLEGATSDAIFE